MEAELGTTNEAIGHGAPPHRDRSLSGLAVVAYCLALLIPAAGFLVGVYLWFARGDRYHGGGAMIVAAVVVALSVTVQLLARG